MPIYLICGLLVDSSLLLPGAMAVPAPDADADVWIRRATVNVPSPAEGCADNWQVFGMTLLFRVPGIVRFMVTDGCEIHFEAEDGIGDAHIAPFLFGAPLGALLHQREQLALQASAVSLDGQALAICGPAGIGKSTLASALCNAGCAFVSDNIAVLSNDRQGKPWLSGDTGQHQLWSDSIAQLGLGDRQGPALREGLCKFHVAPASIAPRHSVPLRDVVILREASAPRAPQLTRLSVPDAAALLSGAIFLHPLLSPMNRDGQAFTQIAALLLHVRVWRLDRHREFSQLNEDVQRLLDQLGSRIP